MNHARGRSPQFHDILWHFQNKVHHTILSSEWTLPDSENLWTQSMRIQAVQLPENKWRNLNCLFAFHSSLFYLKIMTNIFSSSHLEHSSLAPGYIPLIFCLKESEWWLYPWNYFLSSDWSVTYHAGLWLADTNIFLPPDKISVWEISTSDKPMAIKTSCPNYTACHILEIAMQGGWGVICVYCKHWIGTLTRRWIHPGAELTTEYFVS